MCAARIRSRPYPKLECKLTFGFDSEENPRWGNFSFGPIGEDSRRAMTRLVGPRRVDFGQSGPRNGEASGLRAGKN
jgi:hypothetical protein